jgi:hypothetical protein
VNDGLPIEVIHGGHDAILEFLFGCDTGMTQDGAGGFGEETLDKGEPGAVRGSDFAIRCSRRGGDGWLKKRKPPARTPIAAPRWPFANLAARSTPATLLAQEGRRGQSTMLNECVGQLTTKPHPACSPLST